MRIPLVVMASLLLGSPARVVAQPDLVNCEDFGFDAPMSCLAVSYTHLTLPTIYSV